MWLHTFTIYSTEISYSKLSGAGHGHLYVACLLIVATVVLAEEYNFIVLCFGKYNFCLCSCDTSIYVIGYILLGVFYMLNAFVLRQGLVRLSALLHNTVTMEHGLCWRYFLVLAHLCI